MQHPSSRDRGASLTAFGAVVLAALFLVTGLVVDGGAQVNAARQAEVVAAQAARAGRNAALSVELSGGDGSAAAVIAARKVLAANGMDGEVSAAGGQVTVSTRTQARTVFLSLIGINTLPATGEASSSSKPS